MKIMKIAVIGFLVIALLAFVAASSYSNGNSFGPKCSKDKDKDGYISSFCLGGNDCDDSSPNVNPGITEIGGFCSDRLDNDCDGLIDYTDKEYCKLLVLP